MARIAVIGSGIAGLACAHFLDRAHRVTLFEAADRLGGHTNTVIVEDPEAGPLAVDTGFIVHNDRNYPNLLRLFERLGVQTQDSEMSFSVTEATTGFTYRATNLRTLLARPGNAVDRRFWLMLRDIAKFYRAGNRYLADLDAGSESDETIGQFLARGGYSQAFVDLHLLPMGAAVWSTSPDRFADYPVATLLRFLRNHGLLGIGDRPQWRTVVGGSSRYVDAIVGRFGGEIRLGCPVSGVERVGTEPGRPEVTVHSVYGAETFDAVVLACHSDQALGLLEQPSTAEREILGAIGYEQNEAVLHTDTGVLSPARVAWAAWNYHVEGAAGCPTLTYDMTNLQRLPGARRYLVTLNPTGPINHELGRYRYAHPQFTVEAVEAQRRVDEIDGVDGIYYCGAYWGYGFHEDGLVSALRVCDKLGGAW